MAEALQVADDTRRGNPLAYLIPLFMGMLDLPYGISIRVLRFFGATRLPKLADTPRRRRRGLTIVLGGIEGPSIFNTQIVRGLLASGYRGAVVRYDWNAGLPIIRSFVNLVSTRHQERGARAVVDIVTAYRSAQPTAPISIIAQSGGCWVAIRAMELLPPNMNISTVVFHAAAVSAEYDVSAAAKRCQRKVISIEACGDYVLLGLGTLLFGTADRRHRLGAGFVGFRQRPTNFEAMRWRPSWLRHGHLGNHTTSAAFAFMRDVIGPRLRTTCDETAPGAAC